MARKDKILESFLAHEIIQEKYKIKSTDLPKLVRDAVNSEIPIVKAIGLIVDNLEERTITDKRLREIVIQHLNQSV